MAVNFLIQWQVDWKPPEAATKLSMGFRNIDERVFHDRNFMENFWHKTVRSIGNYIKQRFDEKPGWPPLKQRYLDWKNRAVSQGMRVQVGTIGQRTAKFTEMGKLTGSLFESATKKGKVANIFEIMDTPSYEGGMFRYSIDLEKLPYAKWFDEKRPFFYLENDEGMKVLKSLQSTLIAKINRLYRMT